MRYIVCKNVLLATALLGLLAIGTGSSTRADDLYLGSTYSYPITYTDNSNTSPVSAGGGSIVISTLNGVTLPWVYCVGLYTDVYVSADYDKTVVTNNGYVNGSLVTNAGNIAYLLDTYATAYAGNTHEEASLQAAIWQIEYGASSSPGTGVVIQSVVGGDLTLFNTLLTAGLAHTAPLDTIRWLSPKNSSSTVYQGLVTIGTPEPSTLAISTLAGLGLLFYVRRSKVLLRRSA